jgi:hypothetical protein
MAAWRDTVEKAKTRAIGNLARIWELLGVYHISRKPPERAAAA